MGRLFRERRFDFTSTLPLLPQLIGQPTDGIGEVGSGVIRRGRLGSLRQRLPVRYFRH
jgi:hypothetical protein